MNFLPVPRKPDLVVAQTLNESAALISITYPYNESTGQCSEFIVEYNGNGTDSGGVGSIVLDCVDDSTILSELDSNAWHTIMVTTVSQYAEDGNATNSAATMVAGGMWTCEPFCCTFIYF